MEDGSIGGLCGAHAKILRGAVKAESIRASMLVERAAIKIGESYAYMCVNVYGNDSRNISTYNQYVYRDNVLDILHDLEVEIYK